MEEVIDAVADLIADKVLEKLWESERMKNFLDGKKPEVHIDDVVGLTQFIKRTVSDEVEEASSSRNVEVDDIDGFETAVKEIAEKVVEDTTFEVSATA